MNKKWFINIAGQILGPFDEYDINQKASSSSDAVIWGRGLSAWLPFNDWKKEKDRTELPVKENETAEEVKWYYKLHKQSFGPFVYADLIQNLKLVADLNAVYLKTDRPNETWADIYSFMHVVDELGISRRSHPRVPIKGIYEGECSTGPFSVKVITISEGGMGLHDNFKFKIGDRIKGTLKSENLFTSISCAADVVYVGADHYTGLKFYQITAESRSIIVEYVKKFNDGDT